MHRLTTLTLAAALAGLGCSHHQDAHAQDGTHHHEHPKDDTHQHHGAAASEVAPAGLNPVQHEMRLLLSAVQQAMDGVARGDVKDVPASFHRVHLAKEATAAAVTAGAWKPPEGTTVARFTALDEAFHGKLEVLVGAASRGDVAATGGALGDVVRDCHACHAEFRR